MIEFHVHWWYSISYSGCSLTVGLVLSLIGISFAIPPTPTALSYCFCTEKKIGPISAIAHNTTTYNLLYTGTVVPTHMVPFLLIWPSHVPAYVVWTKSVSSLVFPSGWYQSFIQDISLIPNIFRHLLEHSSVAVLFVVDIFSTFKLESRMFGDCTGTFAVPKCATSWNCAATHCRYWLSCQSSSHHLESRSWFILINAT